MWGVLLIASVAVNLTSLPDGGECWVMHVYWTLTTTSAESMLLVTLRTSPRAHSLSFSCYILGLKG
jgi:hypothetical protein